MHGSLPSGPLGRTMILTGSVGSGHTRAAQAVREALLRCHDAESAEVLDVLAFATPVFRAAYRDAYVSLIERAPGVVGWIYRSSDTTEGGRLRRMLQRSALARMRARIAADRPDTIICTHFLASELVEGMVARGEWHGTFGVVVTDLDAHAMWAVPLSADRWFVALDETREILVGKGVPRERVAVTGIPISAAFSATLPPRANLRAAHGFAAEGPLLLVSGGGVGVSMLDRTLETLLEMPIDGSIALVCGKNESLRARAARLVAEHPRSRVRCNVLGFTDRMHELMRIADLSIGKPGGLTSSEALASGLPMAIVHPVPGQEERNSDHLLEWGCAIRLNSPESLGWRVEGLLRDQDRLEEMRTRALARARPHAAESVVSILADLHRPPVVGVRPEASDPATKCATTHRSAVRSQGSGEAAGIGDPTAPPPHAMQAGRATTRRATR